MPLFLVYHTGEETEILDKEPCDVTCLSITLLEKLLIVFHEGVWVCGLWRGTKSFLPFSRLAAQ